MPVFSVRGFTAATAATADHSLAELWNNNTTKAIKVLEVGVSKAGGAGAAGDSLYICRTTARGTAGSTVTPDADNSWELAGSTSTLLDLAAFSVQPTKAAPNMWGWTAAAVAGAGIIWPTPRGIWIPQSGGLAIVQRAATAWPTSEVYFVYEEV